ncbi:MAG: GNAT family N-acetyltransferase [Clostridia bacterium]|nr:GNAT family N-acetyltransferase [Clostridia bacterium]
MIELSDYLSDPCGTLSIPYWKAKRIAIPPHMRIVHDRDFSPELLSAYRDEPYFRLYHDLYGVTAPKLPGFTVKTATVCDTETIVSVLNRSYSDLQIDLTQLQNYRKTPVYAEVLWILVNDTQTGECIGCGIADYDREAEELILEWIQVLPEYRRRGVGSLIVDELLHRGRALGAAFATVSGKAENPTKPELLYRACGFTGSDVWHVLTKYK